MLEIKNLSVHYKHIQAVNQISLKFLPGKITGIIGPNGAGKSTLLKAMLGLVGDYQGEVRYGNYTLDKDRDWIKRHTGYAPEDAELLPYLTGKEFLEMIATLYKSDDPEGLVDYFIRLSGLEAKASELILNYSHGMKQKLSLAAALVGKPDFLILDEAFNGLDPVSLFRMKSYLNEYRRGNKTIVITSHIISLIRDWCDPVFVMHEGKILREYTSKDINDIEKTGGISFEEYFVRLVDG